MRWHVPFITLALGAALLFFAAPGHAFHGSIAVGTFGSCSNLLVSSVDTTTYAFGHPDDITVTPTDASCSGDNALDRTFVPGSSITLRYEVRSGSVPPPTADTITLQVRFDHQAGTVIRTFNNGTPPATGTFYTFWLTDDGTSTGTPSAGTVRAYIRITHDNAINTLDYDCDTDGSSTLGASIDCFSVFIGPFRARTNATSISAPAPPSGSVYAFGTAANEQATVTATRTRAFASDTGNDLRISTIRTTGATVENGADTDHSTGTTTAASFSIDHTYDQATTTYGVSLAIQTISGLTGEAYTVFEDAGLGTGIVFVSSTLVRDLDVFDANSIVQWDEDGTGPATNDVTTNFEVYNRGEDVTFSGRLLNARDEQLTRSLTIQVRDVDTDTLVHSLTDTGPIYGDTFTVAAGDPAEADNDGAPYRVRTSTTDMTQFSNPAFGVSSKLFVDTHTQTNMTLDKDVFGLPASENSTEAFTFISGEDSIHTWCHVVNVRRDTEIDTIANAVTTVWVDSAGATVNTVQHQTGSDGWTSRSSEPATPPTGTWEVTCSATHSANSGSTTQEVDVISAFTGDKIIRYVFWRDFGPSTVRIWAQTEFTDMSFPPDEAPDIIIAQHLVASNLMFQRIVTDKMFNALDHTQTSNGSLYYYDFDLDTFGHGNYSIVFKAFISGTPIRQVALFETQTSGDTLTQFETTTGFDALEIALFMAMAFAGIMLWLRSNDLAVRGFGVFLCLATGAMYLSVVNDQGLGNVWAGSVVMASSFVLVGAYMLIRMFIDEFVQGVIR